MVAPASVSGKSTVQVVAYSNWQARATNEKTVLPPVQVELLAYGAAVANEISPSPSSHMWIRRRRHSQEVQVAGFTSMSDQPPCQSTAGLHVKSST